jgi:glyoxylase-like metal-dependent hydrolase (beta-lactamase superfamily II)
MNIRSFVASGFAENAYLIWQPGQRQALAIDPGDAPSILQTLSEEKLELSAILLTHSHIDHIDGVAHLVRATEAAIYLHPEARLFYDNAAVQGAQFGMRVENPPPPTHQLNPGETLQLAGIELEVRFVPGHAPGHVLLYNAANSVAFVGDVVFQGSIGRTDLPGGDYQLLMTSIREQVMTLPEETRLYSGHGPVTTVGEERRFNPFIAPMYGGSFA